MNYLKSFLSLVAFLLFLSPATVFGASYPASCPVEARSIIDAVGGCSTIDPSQYSSIYGKCCSVSATPASQVSSEPTLEDPSSGLPPDISYTSDTSGTSSSAAFSIFVSILILGGLVYLGIWFVRKRKEKKGLASTVAEKKCPYCKSVIPGDATRCSHCQADVRNWLRRHPILTAIVASAALLFIIGLFSQS